MTLIDRNELYYAVAAQRLPLDDVSCLTLDRENRPLEISHLEAAVLDLCTGARTLANHESCIFETGIVKDRAVCRLTLERLLGLGLLQPASTLFNPTEASRKEALHPIRSVVFITADRPDKLRRAIQAMLSHNSSSDHPPRYLVVDGSKQYQRETREAVTNESASHKVPIEYWGQAEVALFRKRLEKRGLPVTVLANALTPGHIGSNRNIAALLTAGDRLVMSDDDVICLPWQLDDVKAGVAIVGHSDPRDWEFFNTRAEALSGIPNCTVNVLEAHATILGRSLEHVIRTSPDCDLELACAHMLSALPRATTFTVRMTFSGLAGDSAMGGSHAPIHFSPQVRSLLESGRYSLSHVLRTREVRRAVSQLTITHDSHCMAYFVGLDNTSMLPPFMPVSRNEDGLFGAMLAICDTQALSAHLPHGVVHDSDRPSAYSMAEQTAPVRTTSMADILAECVRLSEFSLAFPESQTSALRSLGECLAALTRRPLHDFAKLISEVVLTKRTRDLARLGRAWGESGINAPTSWPAFEEYREALREASSQETYCLPKEFHTSPSLHHGFEQTRLSMNSFAALVSAWPDVWEAAADERIKAVAG